MKLKALLTLITTLTISFHAAFAADDDTPLAKNMSSTNKMLRALKKQIADPAKKDENVGVLEKIKTNVTEAAKLEPKKTKDIPEAEKAAYLEKYKKEMAALLQTFTDLQTAVKDGKTDEAKAFFDKLVEQKEKGHKDFSADDE